MSAAPGQRGAAAGTAADLDAAVSPRGATGLAPFRARLDLIDEEIARLLGERFQICREVAVHKSRHGIPMMQPHRVEVVRRRYLDRGEDAGLPSDFCAALFDLLIAATCREEDELMDRLARDRKVDGTISAPGDVKSSRQPVVPAEGGS